MTCHTDSGEGPDGNSPHPPLEQKEEREQVAHELRGRDRGRAPMLRKKKSSYDLRDIFQREEASKVSIYVSSPDTSKVSSPVASNVSSPDTSQASSPDKIIGALPQQQHKNDTQS